MGSQWKCSLLNLVLGFFLGFKNIDKINIHSEKSALTSIAKNWPFLNDVCGGGGPGEGESTSISGVARLFWSRAKVEKYFPSRAALFKIGHKSEAEKNLGSVRGSMNSFSLNLSTCTAFSKTKGCPRAAKISWRAAQGPRLIYMIKCDRALPGRGLKITWRHLWTIL